MLKRALLALLAVPAIAGLTLVAVRLTPGPQRDGTTLLPSGWRIHPAGRQVDVGTLPLNVVTLSDGSVLVTNNGYGENGLMRIDPLAGSVVWRLPLKAAWLGLARSGRDWRGTLGGGGGGGQPREPAGRGRERTPLETHHRSKSYVVLFLV